MPEQTWTYSHVTWHLFVVGKWKQLSLHAWHDASATTKAPMPGYIQTYTKHDKMEGQIEEEGREA